MSIPNNINREHIEKAIIEIQKADIPPKRESDLYFLKLGNIELPPKYVLSIANKFANNEELLSKDFQAVEAKSFLTKLNYTILVKNNKTGGNDMSFFGQLTKFLKQAQTSELKYSDYLKEYLGLKVKVGFGQGNQADITWISFLKEGEKVRNGIYPVFLYYKKFDFLILAYGISETNTPDHSWNLENGKTIKDFFVEKDLKPKRKYYKDSFVFKVYEIKPTVDFGLDEDQINADLNELIEIYKNLDSQTTPRTTPSKDTPSIQKYMREIVAIKTKPFVILAGLSGTGKSRLVRTLSYKFNNIEEDRSKQIHPPSNFQLIKVKPNWHDSSELLGYESRISGKDRFIATDFIRFIVKAWQCPDSPFFLCLDEMNLAPVEQYFAEYLSVIETRRIDKEGEISSDALVSSSLIKKYANKPDCVDPSYDLWNELEATDVLIQQQLQDKGLRLPPNLIVMGTVNMDETTHSFSRKVLDRAMTFEMNDIVLSEGLIEAIDNWKYPTFPIEKKVLLSEKTQGTEVYNSLGVGKDIILYLEEINQKLEGSPFKIAYRVRDEFLLYAYNYSLHSSSVDWFDNVLDDMTLMKILPRIEGDEERTKLLDDLVVLFSNKKMPRSLKKAIEMVDKRNQFHYTSFWS